METTPTQRDHRRDTRALLEIARTLGITCAVDDLFRKVISYSMELLEAERATLFLYDAAREELYSHTAEGVGQVRIPVSTGIAGAAARSLKIVNIPDAYADERFNRSIDSKTGFRTRSILACPLTDYSGRLVGVLQVLNKRVGSFSAEDIEVAEAFSAQAGVAIQRTQLLEEQLEKQRLEAALRVAQEIQQHLLPNAVVPLAGFDLACWHRPCDATGGDYCDLFPLDEHRVLVTLGDVTGHGVGPALISCATQAMMRALADEYERVDEVMKKVNRLLAADLPENRFVTAFLGILDNRRQELAYCSAGQGPLLRYEARSGQVEVIGAGCIPMGILDDLDMCETLTIRFEPGDMFVLLTDGFYEWPRSDGELFGVARVSEILQREHHQPGLEIIGALRRAIEAFSDVKQTDDLTAIIVTKS